ncbi:MULTISPECIES: hypothetical protein [Helcococcus]|uniref:Uncharacterized protein n=1 Tax=Helcococcus bovis TaxID=3153252 RepID=A0ABW9F4W6_9FIRM
MLELLKENLSRVVTLVQEKYGELTKSEVSEIQETPNKLFDLLETKFGVNRADAEKFLTENLGNISDIKGKLGSEVSGVADKIGNLFGGDR